MNRLTISAAFILTIVLVATRAYSCTCEIHGDGSPESSRRHAKALFIGEVLEVREATKGEREDSSNSFIVRMRVEGYWKGIKSREVNVETDMTGCGPYFRVGEKFLVYGMGRRLETACSGTRKLEYADKDLRILGKPKEWKSE
jgi:hypothetical protein